MDVASYLHLLVLRCGGASKVWLPSFKRVLMTRSFPSHLHNLSKDVLDRHRSISFELQLDHEENLTTAKMFLFRGTY